MHFKNSLKKYIICEYECLLMFATESKEIV